MYSHRIDNILPFSLTGGKNIDLKTAIHWIEEDAKYGVKEVMLSGGETLCYPHLYDVVSAARKYCGGANVALSGYGFTQEVYEQLIDAGVTGIYISLNGSNAEINSLTRDGFDLAINALSLLKLNGFKNTTINWVMHSSNANDFANVLGIAESQDVANLTIMAVKSDSKKELKTLPSRNQMEYVKSIMRGMSVHKTDRYQCIEDLIRGLQGIEVAVSGTDQTVAAGKNVSDDDIETVYVPNDVNDRTVMGDDVPTSMSADERKNAEEADSIPSNDNAVEIKNKQRGKNNSKISMIAIVAIAVVAIIALIIVLLLPKGGEMLMNPSIMVVLQ